MLKLTSLCAARKSQWPHVGCVTTSGDFVLMHEDGVQFRRLRSELVAHAAVEAAKPSRGEIAQMCSNSAAL